MLTKMPMVQMPNILFLYNTEATFVFRDLDILRSKYRVRAILVKGKVKGPLNIIRNIMWADMVFCWFADVHGAIGTVLARLFSKKSMIVVGGYDISYQEPLHEGLLTHPIKKAFPKIAILFADLLLPVSQTALAELIEIWPHIESKAKLVYHGFDDVAFAPNPERSKENMVLTVGQVSYENIIRKGFRHFIAAAQELPETSFVLVGRWLDNSIEELRRMAPQNVIFTGYMPNEELLNYFQRAKVYVQLSAYEAFGCALAEAMLCDCVPVVTKGGAIPEVVGNEAFFVDNPRDIDQVVKAIRKALMADATTGRKARERIRKNFPLEKRKKEIIQLVEATLG